MKAFHAIGGTPRSGSTLLCNILNQNPRFHASSTSCIAASYRALSRLWSTSPALKSDRIHDKEAADARMLRSSRAMIESWYEDKEDAIIFDKGRLWNNQPLPLKHIFPESHLFVCVRDLRDVLASVEKRHTENPILDLAQTPEQLTLLSRATRMFSPDGDIGAPLLGVEDLYRRQLGFVHFIQFETLVRNPKLIMDGIYTALGEDGFEHDFKNVECTATDVDGLYHDKFPHDGSGEVKPPEGKWSDYISPDIAAKIMQEFPTYNRAFNYSG
jgi:sulfotransferase